MSAKLPIVGMVGDLKQIDGMPYHALGDKYASAIREHASCLPINLVSSRHEDDICQIVDTCDGFVFTGSASNIDPTLYDGAVSNPPYDPERDAFAITLARKVLDSKKPGLFICRGFQELNVATGGSLNPDISLDETYRTHHPDAGLPYDERYALLHEVELEADSPLLTVFGARRFPVNSLHYQGLDRLGQGLTVHGRAPDGLPEIIAADDHPFAIGVQWHPEYRPDRSPASASLLKAFGAASRKAIG